MYCPKCGHLQASEAARFCAKCGLPLENITKLVTTGSAPPSAESNSRKGQLSPRLKGVLQGVAIIPCGIGAWFILDIIYEGVFGAGMLGGLYAMFTLILLAALIRIIYAIIFDEGATLPRSEFPLPYVERSEMGVPSSTAVLQRAISEQSPPLSVTEGTTEHLDTNR